MLRFISSENTICHLFVSHAYAALTLNNIIQSFWWLSFMCHDQIKLIMSKLSILRCSTSLNSDTLSRLKFNNSAIKMRLAKPLQYYHQFFNFFYRHVSNKAPQPPNEWHQIELYITSIHYRTICQTANIEKSI